MNKTVIMVCLVIFELIGSYLPVVIFKVGMLSGWSILGGVIGGFVGIWVGAMISKRLG